MTSPRHDSIRTRTSVDHRRCRVAIAALVLFAAPVVHAAAPVDEITATRKICLEGPDSAVARAVRESGTAAVTSAHVLPNPTVVANYNQTLTGIEDNELVVGVSVPLGIGGRRLILQDAADERLKQANAEAHATLFESSIAFREAYVNAVVDQARVQARTDQQAALEALSDTIRGLQKGGEASGYDLMRQQAQVRLHRRMVESTKADALASLALLEAWLNTDVTLPSVDLSALAGGSRACC